MKLRDLTFIYHTSIKEVAQKMGVSEMSIYQLCYTKYPSYDKIKKTAEAIGCEVSELEEVIRDGRKKLEEKNKNNFSTFKELLKAQNKTQENLAESVSVTVGYISQIERGITKVNLEMLSNIAEVLGCDISEFLSDTVKLSNNYLFDEFNEILFVHCRIFSTYGLLYVFSNKC